ncbi:Zn-ribbon domain-containing OB-fold protein [Aquabacterium sp.]|uniref:Zn-ribbon domain-containing OB-fold protein n=1 Tax=Aquabacterium sp. TaxID=1872578 RepID=UPI002C8E8B4C|nr:OB-fold domain-containing protein [Aquabacterium sp.]HSW06810.1 OB-fold domain-containing protein [Aquabacterium sp.]
MNESPSPAGGSAQRTYQAALNEGRWLIQHCTACQHAVFYPRELCPHCGAPALRWVAPSGLGTVYAVTTVRRKPDAGGDLNVTLIDLDEGVRLMSRVEGLASDAVRIGMRVRSRVTQQDGAGLVVFDAVDGGVK